jgi:hypothetical protein
MSHYLTVVYTINDAKAFEPTRKKIFEDFHDSGGRPVAATAVSLDHEMQRMHWIEQAAGSIDDYYDLREMIDYIVSHPDIGNVSDLDELRGH